MKRFISMLLFFALLFGVIVIPDRAEAMEQAKEEREAAAVIEKPPESVKSEDRVETEQTDVDEEQQKKGKDVQENKEWYRILPSDEVEVREVAGEEPDTDITREASVVLALNSGSSASVKSVEEVVLQVGERVSYGSWSTNYFYINGQLAYCLEPRKGTPSSGNYIADVLQNDHLTKGMYYLMGGPGFTPEIREAFFSSAAGFSEKQIYAFCHAILSFIYSGYNLNSDAFIGLNKEERDGISTISYQIRDMLPAPPEGKVSIQPPHQNAKWNEESKSQWTDVYQVEGDARNLLKFTLPAGVRLHNLITGAVMQSAATVKGGDSSDGWTLLKTELTERAEGDPEQVKGYVVYTYAYNSMVADTEDVLVKESYGKYITDNVLVSKTTSLFEKVRLINCVEGQLDKVKLQVPIKTFAIQAAHTGNDADKDNNNIPGNTATVIQYAKTAFEKYANQNADNGTATVKADNFVVNN